MIEHLGERYQPATKCAQLAADEETIIKAAPLEQYHHCQTMSMSASHRHHWRRSRRQPDACESHSSPDGHYGLIVSIQHQQIPSGGVRHHHTQRELSQSPDGRLVAGRDGLRWRRWGRWRQRRANIYDDGDSTSRRRPRRPRVNDNPAAANESQESSAACDNTSRRRHERVGGGHHSGKPQTTLIINRRRDSCLPEVEPSLCSNRIKSAACLPPSRLQLQPQRCANIGAHRHRLNPMQSLQPLDSRAAGRKWSLSIIGKAEAIRLVRLEAPHSIQAGQPLKLRCLYETRGDKLQSLSWYRNGREFYRYQPFERRQPVLAFNSTGVQVDVSVERPQVLPRSWRTVIFLLQ
jgi:hypothetical protein